MRRYRLAVVVFAALTALSSLATGDDETIEALSLLGEPLFRPPLSSSTLEVYNRNLERARADFNADPADADAIVWLGRRTAYLGRYREAIEIFTMGAEKHPDDPRMFRHRGHRCITIRELDLAIADLAKASDMIRGESDPIEPDGLPNARNQPTSTLQGNIWYHLGLAQYLKGDFESALESYRQYMQTAKNDDSVVAGRYWLWMIFMRMGREEEAAQALDPINAEMDVIENQSYHRLCLMFKGVVGPDEILRADATPLELATVGYGVGLWHLIRGDEDMAFAIFRDVIATEFWPAFGFIAAEAELARAQRSEEPIKALSDF